MVSSVSDPVPRIFLPDPLKNISFNGRVLSQWIFAPFDEVLWRFGSQRGRFSSPVKKTQCINREEEEQWTRQGLPSSVHLNSANRLPTSFGLKSATTAEFGLGDFSCTVKSANRSPTSPLFADFKFFFNFFFNFFLHNLA